MFIKVSYTKVVYSLYRPDFDNMDIAHRERCTKNIYDGRVTKARIYQEIPKLAVVEKIEKVDKRYDVDGEKVLDWLSRNGTVKK